MLSEKEYKKWQSKLSPYARDIWNAYVEMEMKKAEIVNRMRNVLCLSSVSVHVDVMGVEFLLKSEKKRDKLPSPRVFIPFDVRVKD